MRLYIVFDKDLDLSNENDEALCSEIVISLILFLTSSCESSIHIVYSKEL